MNRPRIATLVLASLGLALASCAGADSDDSPAGTPSSGDPTTQDPDLGQDATGDPAPGSDAHTAENSDPLASTDFQGWPADPATLDGDEPAKWSIDIVDTLPHDPHAFTQGYEVVDGVLFESTGLRGESTLRTVEIATGDVLEQHAIAADLFGEGLTRSGDEIVQLTWQAGLALRWQLPALTPLDPFTFDHDGWGICEIEPGVLAVTDGTPLIRFRRADDFAHLDDVSVTFGGREVSGLNELECIDGWILANVWRSELILVIDPAIGNVIATIDATAASDLEGRTGDNREVLNGIAQLDSNQLALTGKLWSTVYIVALTE